MLIRTGRRRRDAVERFMIDGRYLPKVLLRRMEGRYEKKIPVTAAAIKYNYRQPMFP